jgi:hypothetical protein
VFDAFAPRRVEGSTTSAPWVRDLRGNALDARRAQDWGIRAVERLQHPDIAIANPLSPNSLTFSPAALESCFSLAPVPAPMTGWEQISATIFVSVSNVFETEPN